MRTPRLLLLSGLIMIAAACGGGDDDRTAQQPAVPVWRPDSAGPASSIDSAPAADPATPPDSAADRAGQPPSGAPGESDATGPAPAGNRGAAANAAPATAPPSTGGEARTAEEILLRAERAYEAVRTLRASFVQDLTVPLLNSTQRSRGEIFHRKPNLFLMRFSDPAGDIVVADGRYLWAYYPSSDPGQVIRTSAGQAGQLDLQREFLSNPTERFDATLEGPATVAGRSAQVLTLVPREAAGYTRVRIWIDDEDALARRFEITEGNENVRRVELHDLRVNVDLADDLFRFTPPADAEIFDQ